LQIVKLLSLRRRLRLHVVELATLVRQIFLNVALSSALICSCLSRKLLLFDLVFEHFVFLLEAVERLLIFGLLSLAFFMLEVPEAAQLLRCLVEGAQVVQGVHFGGQRELREGCRTRLSTLASCCCC